MAFVVLGGGGGVRGALLPSPPHQTQDRTHSFLLLVSPLFPLLFFLSLFLPLSQAGSQVEILNGGKEGGGPGRRTTEPLSPGSSRAQERSLRWGQKEVAHSLHPPLPLAVGPGLGEAPRPLSVWAPASGLFPVHQHPLEFLSSEQLRTWKNWLP